MRSAWATTIFSISEGSTPSSEAWMRAAATSSGPRRHLFWSEPRSVRGSAMPLLSPLKRSQDTSFAGWRHGVITHMR
jgi:hypothetical protein